MWVPISFLLGGGALLFLRTIAESVSNSFFGVGNILQYESYNPYNIFSSMRVIIQAVGVVWFIRGCVLLVHSSDPGVKSGSKGLTFLIGGIFALNFEATYSMLNYIVNALLKWTHFSTST